MPKSLGKIIKEAEEKKVAIGHFNVSDTEGLWAIFNSAKGLNLPVIIGVSEGERDFIGPKQAVALVRSLREEYDYPIYINADHTYSFERIKEAVQAGFDAVIFDGAKLSLEENIRLAKKSVDYAKSVNPEILVEAELGYIGTSSKLLDEIPEGAEIEARNLVRPEQALDFVQKTGVDLLAPAVGNLHGMLKHASNPNLDILRIKKIREEAGIPLVLHGGSGISDEDFQNAVRAGISIIHVNTALRKAYREGLEKSLAEKPEELAPYRFMEGGVEGMKRVVEKHLKLFNFM
ncbi:tagatose-bisphosphate aldolase [Candidatus Campbellbacteria bacterium CG11_big_fil_rev_8_21_14_0_20_44_21]|uniref:Tagatose-bisphosphate aldolase n=1 Tax=Candidatus Campbellbacteria bacterium CG22_combo_CG10-13_8_21_14_all_43_18 TaxID=1974530 RepID=A0A2H0DX73_9BACT|nr:MAG: tagatose-bisphosphate aldolase [Candidatus Campbellbacteria bacterium CG22_combo_CG10-13_8_21_14_all_43_18]PIR24536.1 MAG: tagatose-bisphosphate aldolase [Candidatus Campbellbacteria bacterium CG11_big_fil_rev_8_21_14_0_20_44_21]